MPTDERLRGHNRQRLFPIEEAGPKHKRQPRRIRQSPQPNLALLVVGQLLAPEQNLGSEGCPGTGNRPRELDPVAQQFCEGSPAGENLRPSSYAGQEHGNLDSHRPAELARSF